MNISLLGAGLMGKPMAIRLKEAGHNVIVYNRTKSKLQELEAEGMEGWSIAQKCVEAGDVILVMLSEYSAIRSVLLESVSIEALKGKTVIQMSTIAPAESRRMAEFLQPLNCQYLEAPVLGSVNEVKAGKLIIMCAGEEKIYHDWRDLLGIFGEKIIYAGEVGKAAALKLALNQMIVTLTSAFSMSLSYIIKSGLPVETFMEILRESALYAPTFDKKLNNMLNNDFSKTNFPTRLLLKDVNLIQKELENNNINSKILADIAEIIESAINSGYSETDYSSIYAAIAKLNG